MSALTQAQPARTLIVLAACLLIAGTYGVGTLWAVTENTRWKTRDPICFALFWVCLIGCLGLLAAAGAAELVA